MSFASVCGRAWRGTRFRGTFCFFALVARAEFQLRIYPPLSRIAISPAPPHAFLAVKGSFCLVYRSIGGIPSSSTRLLESCAMPKSVAHVSGVFSRYDLAIPVTCDADARGRPPSLYQVHNEDIITHLYQSGFLAGVSNFTVEFPDLELISPCSTLPIHYWYAPLVMKLAITL